MNYLNKNYSIYKQSIDAAVNWYISVLKQDINVDAVKESRLKRACQSKESAYRGIVAILNRGAVESDIKESVISALKDAWMELSTVVAHHYKLAKFDEEDGIDPDVSTTVCEAKIFAEHLMVEIADSIDALEANEEVLKEKARENKNPLHTLRVS